MKVQILENFAHLSLGSVKVGDIVDVKQTLAKQLIKSQLAEKVEIEKKVDVDE